MTLDVHCKAALGFNREAAAYDRGRPGYPSEVYDFILSEFGWTPATRLVDLAAGTGKFTRGLIERSLSVTAVEPVAGMRERFSANFPDCPALEGTAERMPFGSGELDAVTVAQAFHWFDGPRALDELHRVLKPGGALIMAWNRRDSDSGWLKNLSVLLESERDAAPGFASGKWKSAFETTTLFEPLQKRDFKHVVTNSRESFLDRIRSISFVGAMDPVEQAGFISRIETLLDASAETRGLAGFEVPHRTEVWWARRRE